MTELLTAGPNREITLTFSLKLVDGQLIDQIDEPATFLWGDESLLPAFQKAMRGCKAGDKRSVFIQARNGFGEASEDNIQYFKPEQLVAAGIQPEVGMLINFSDDHRLNQNEADVSGVITAITEDWITVNFNHPLAGRDLMFGFEIHDIQVAPMTLGIATHDITDTSSDITNEMPD
jgi:FKBP-type peptidyl-prolyl cis-trans isomerase SlpA